MLTIKIPLEHNVLKKCTETMILHDDRSKKVSFLLPFPILPYEFFIENAADIICLNIEIPLEDNVRKNITPQGKAY